MANRSSTSKNMLRAADEVNMFPSLELAAPKTLPQAPSSSSGSAASKRLRIKTKLPSSSSSSQQHQQLLPGLLKSGKTTISEGGRAPNADDFLTFVGFNATHIYFDGESIRPRPLDTTTMMGSKTKGNTTTSATSAAGNKNSNNNDNDNDDGEEEEDDYLYDNNGPTKTIIDMNLEVPLDESAAAAATKSYAKIDPVMEELRNYAVLLDKFSLHNFMIYNGQTLKDTPEFHSFRRTYNHEWGAIAVIVTALEKLLKDHSVKLAIINGPSVYDLASLNPITIERDDLILCISNIDQVRPQLRSLFNEEAADVIEGDPLELKNRAAIKCQALIRRFLGVRRVKRLRRRIAAATTIQSIARRMIYRRIGLDRMKVERSFAEQRWASNREKLNRIWKSLNTDTSASSSSASSSQQRLVIYIPSMSAAEYLRIDMDSFRAAQNMHIAALSQLADPDVTMLYISPCLLGPSEQSYHDKFLSVLGINTLPKRLHFIVPEMLSRLPHHLTAPHVLWCSSVALRKIKNYVKRFPNAYIIPTNVGWIEKKIAHILDVPMLSPNPSIVETIKSRSYLKKIFTNSQLNIPIGAHDIFSTDDLFVALTRLIACNLHVRKWLLRLNHDCNNESLVMLDTNKITFVTTLRAEQRLLFENSGGQTGAWFTKNVQLSVRKRLLDVLTVELAAKVSICRKDIYMSWEMYTRHMQRIGLVIEAEPIEKLGYVESLFFIEPTGEIVLHGGVDVVVDDKYQTQTFIAPQTLTPPAALAGATRALGTYLFETLNVIGYVTVKFCAFWDGLDNIPRIWAHGVHFGHTPSFGASATACIASDPNMVIPRSLQPVFPAEGKHFVHVPIAIHFQLRGSRDDLFFKLCRMRGIAFDAAEHTGTLFFLLDAIVGGAVSFTCIANSRFRALEQAVHCLNFITTQFGKEKDQGKGVSDAKNLCSVLLYLRRVYKAEEKRVGPLSKQQ